MIDHIEERHRLEAVVAAARTGDKILIKLALDHLDQLRGPGELSVRSTDILRRLFGDDAHQWASGLAGMTEAEFLRTPNTGRKSLNELRDWLAELGKTFKPVSE